jgi:hypothetical protein
MALVRGPRLGMRPVGGLVMPSGTRARQFAHDSLDQVFGVHADRCGGKARGSRVSGCVLLMRMAVRERRRMSVMLRVVAVSVGVPVRHVHRMWMRGMRMRDVDLVRNRGARMS